MIGGSRLFAACFVAVALTACVRPSAAPFAPSPQAGSARDSVTHEFYSGKSYGTESQFNPFSLVINGGLDELRIKDNRNIFTQPYGAEIHTVFYTITHPEPVLRHYGYRNWLTHEVFPLSQKNGGGGQWTPNYELHLFAGGMTYYRTVEWYEQHGVAHPRLAAGLTVFTWHLLTEMTESDGRCCEDEDGLTDLYIFDTGSILLWNQAWVRQLFRGRIEFTDWPGQPTMMASGRLENTYMMSMLRVPLPRTDDIKAMTVMGAAFLLGPSVRINRQLWFSAAAGYDPADNPIIDPRTNARTATLLLSGGVFLDRNGSLLASFVSRGGQKNGPTFNLYPGVIGSGWWSPGLWVQSVSGGGLRFGVVSKLGVGFGGTRR
jgi:hypothetical protein